MIRIWFIIFVSAVLVTACGRFGRDDVRNGAALFEANCAICHGRDAQGGGGAGVHGLSKTPPDLTRLSRDNDGMFPVSETIATLEGYAEGGLRGRQVRGFLALQSEREKRVRIDRTRVQATEPIVEILVFLESIQQP